MDSKELRGLMEAYSEVYAPEQLDEASRRDEFTRAAIARSSGRKGGITFEPGPNWDPSANRGKGAHLSPKQKEKQRRKALRQEDFDIFDEVLEFLQVEGYAETLEEAEWMMANMIDEEAIGIILGEEQLDEISQKTATRAYAASSTGEFEGQDSPRDVKRTDNLRRQIKRKFGDKAAQHADRAAHAMTFGRKSKFVKMPPKPTKEDFELWVNELVEEGYDLSDYTWGEMYDIYEAEKPFPYEKVKSKQVALRDKGGNALDRRMKMGMAVRRAKEAEKTGGSQRDAGKGWYHAKEEYVDEAQAARENPEKYEREQAKKSAPVRGERTPMPPRGDKRREEFEKWYAKQMGR